MTMCDNNNLTSICLLLAAGVVWWWVYVKATPFATDKSEAFTSESTKVVKADDETGVFYS